MKSIHIFICLLIISFSSDITSQAQDKPLAIKNVNVIPMDSERILENQTVLIDGNIISAIADANTINIPEDAVVIDGSGKYLLPGLFDMHVHLSNENEPLLYVANGVTTVQNMRGDEWHLELCEKVKNGEIIGPKIFTTGPTTSQKRIDTNEKAEQLVMEQKAAGYDAIKHYGSGTREGMTRETYDHLLETAKKNNIPVVGHAPRNMPFSVVLEGGQSSIDHAEEIYYTYKPIYKLYKPFIDFQFGRITIEEYRNLNPASPEVSETKAVLKTLAKEVKEAGLFITPTLTTFETIWKNTTSDYFSLMQDDELKYIEPYKRASWHPQSNRYRTIWADRLKEVGTVLRESLELQKLMVKEFVDAGVPVMTGTDAPLTFVYPGFTIHRELEIFVETGISPFNALRSATITPAKFLKIDDEYGTVTAGKKANLILLDGNPLDDINNTRKISGIILNGKWMPDTFLDSLLTQVAKSYEPEWNLLIKVQEHLDKNDVESALKEYKKLTKDEKNEALADYLEGVVNDLGYNYIANDDLDKAFEVLKLNTEYFPEAYNTWDSLAEVYMIKGENELTIKYYKKSLELNPNNNNAVRQLEKLEE